MILFNPDDGLDTYKVCQIATNTLKGYITNDVVNSNPAAKALLLDITPRFARVLTDLNSKVEYERLPTRL